MAMQLSKQEQQYVGAGAVLFLVLSGMYVKFFWLPISQAKSEAGEKIEQIESKIVKAKQQAARLERLQAEIASLNERAAEAEKRLPKTKSVPDILLAISALAQKNRVIIQSFTPGVTMILADGTLVRLSQGADFEKRARALVMGMEKAK